MHMFRAFELGADTPSCGEYGVALLKLEATSGATMLGQNQLELLRILAFHQTRDHF